MWKWLYGAHLAKRVDMLGTFAAALSYSFVLSVVPFLVIAFALTTELVGPLNASAYQETLDRILPLEKDNRGDLYLDKHIAGALEAARSSSLARVVGLFFALYASFNLMNQIVRTLLFIFDDQRRVFEWTWRIFSKTIAILTVWTLLLLTVTVSSVLSIFFHHNAKFLSLPWRLTSDMAMIASLFGAVFVTYYLVPVKRPRLRAVRDGALVASVGWIGCSLVFTRVLPQMIGLNMVYQALGSIVVILLWSQACAWSLIIGACWTVRFNARPARR